MGIKIPYDRQEDATQYNTMRATITILTALATWFFATSTAVGKEAESRLYDTKNHAVTVISLHYESGKTAHEIKKHIRNGSEETTRQIKKYIRKKRAKIGVAWAAGGNSGSVNDRWQYPMMSVFKLHVAVAVLRQMEREGASPDSTLHIEARQMNKDTYSPLRELHPDTAFDISIRELLHYSVAQSDNNACDILIAYAGGTDNISREMHSIGLDGFRITETEESMHTDTRRCKNNSSTPGSVVILLRKVFEGDILTGVYADCIRQTLLSTTTGADKIRAALAPGMLLAHKTGSSGRDKRGMKTGDNDAGLIIMPDGRRCYVAVFITRSMESDADNAATIADITRIILKHTGCK